MGEVVPTWELWDHLRDVSLASDSVERLLGGPNRVYVSHDEIPEREGEEGTVWARIVIVPTSPTWGRPHSPGQTQQVAFVLRAEVPQLHGKTGYSPSRLSWAVQRAAHDVLQGLVPVGPFKDLMVALPIHARREPQPTPLLDTERGVLYTSSEYGLEVAPEHGVL